MFKTEYRVVRVGGMNVFCIEQRLWWFPVWETVNEFYYRSKEEAIEMIKKFETRNEVVYEHKG